MNYEIIVTVYSDHNDSLLNAQPSPLREKVVQTWQLAA